MGAEGAGQMPTSALQVEGRQIRRVLWASMRK
jgi:hypothetical protein